MMELRKISKEKLHEIVEAHENWLDDKHEGKKAKLSNVDLAGLCINCRNLNYADFNHSNLIKTNLSWSKLSGSNFHCTSLKEADLMFVDLSGADLSSADLSNANLIGANLKGALLADTILEGADLTNADLTGAKLSGSTLSKTNLNKVIYNYKTSFLALQCPEKGSFIGYKKSGDKIVELRIEEDSLRCSATTRSCRASKVTVLSITSIDGKKEFKEVSNTGYHPFTYRIGETYEIKGFDKDRWEECSTGIHFFITRDEAVSY